MKTRDIILLFFVSISLTLIVIIGFNNIKKEPISAEICPANTAENIDLENVRKILDNAGLKPKAGYY